MPGSARFGGQIDAGGILLGVYKDDQARREALTGQAIQRAREEQNALDRDAQDRWQSGQMSDEDWLAYARDRVAHGVGSAEQEQWRETLRKSEDMIAVNQAEFAYQSGGSINQLIAFWQQRVKGMSGSGQEVSDARNRLNDLIDKRLSDETTTGVDKIQAAVDAGTLPPSALLDYLKGQRGKARANSTLASQLDKDITQATESINANKRQSAIADLQYRWQNGDISGNQYGAQLRQLAGTFQYSNPQTYYQMLTEAGQAEHQYGDFGFDGTAGGGGGSGTGGGRSGTGTGGSATGRPQRLSDLTTQWDDATWRAQSISQQVLEGNKVVTDPGTGEQVDVTTKAGREWLANVHRDAVSTYHAMTYVGESLGNDKLISAGRDGLTEYVTKYAQPSNTLAAAEVDGMFMHNITSGMESLGRETDPAAASRKLDSLANQVDAYIASKERGPVSGGSVRAAVNPIASLFGGAAGAKVTSTATKAAAGGAPIEPGSTETPEHLNELRALSGLLHAQTPDEVQAALQNGMGLLGQDHQGDLINSNFLSAVANGQDGGFGGVSVVRDMAVGVLEGRYSYVVTPNGPTLVPSVPTMVQTLDPQTGQLVMTQTLQPDSKTMDSLFPEGRGRPVAVAVQVGDHVVRMSGFTTQEATPWQQWIAGKDGTIKVQGQDFTVRKGGSLPSQTWNNMTPDEQKAAQASGVVVLGNASVEVLHTRDGKGNDVVFSRLPGGAWVKGAIPLKASMNGDGTVQVDANGNIVGSYKPTATVPVPFVGTDAHLMQQAVDNGMFDADIATVHDVDWTKGTPSADPYNPSASYYTPEESAKVRAKGVAQGQRWEDYQAQVDQSDWWDTRARQEKASNDYNAKVRAQRDAAKWEAQQAQMRPQNGGDTLRSLFDQEGSALGIRFGGKTMPREADQQPMAPTSWPEQQMPKLASQLHPAPIGKPQDQPLSNLPAPHASSGPGLSSVPPPNFTPTVRPAASAGSFIARLLGLGDRTNTPTPTAPTPIPTTTSPTGKVTKTMPKGY